MYRKIVITGGVTEITEYEHLNVNSEGGYRPGDGKNTEENYRQRQRLRRNKIRQLICANFDSSSKFVTLTFRDGLDMDIRDVKCCNALFKVFVQRLRYKYPSFKYVSVVEFQDKNDRGAVHYHMICNLPYIKKAELSRLWGNGFIKINAIDKVDNVGAYVIKYMVADMEDRRLCGLKAYLRSRGLEEPLEVCSWREEDREVIGHIDSSMESKTPSYFREYESEYAGSIKYYQYNMNRHEK